MVHLAALEAAATAQTGGGRGWRGRGEGGGAGAVGEKREWEAGREERERRWRRWGGSQDEALEVLDLARLLCAEPLAVWAAGSLGSIPGDCGGSARGRVGGGCGRSLPLNLAKWQHLRAL